VFLDHHPDPLGFGYTPSRFSDPRKNPAARFGVYYVGESFETAFLETIVRDRKNGNPGPLILSAGDLDAVVHVHVIVQTPLLLVDLRGGLAIAMGIPTDAVRAASHLQARRTSPRSTSTRKVSMEFGIRRVSTARRISRFSIGPFPNFRRDRAARCECVPNWRRS
jgi:RES domain